jgi:Effector Associated Constant Component 1
MSGHATVGLTALSERYDPDDDRWREQVADLVHDLRVETGTVQHVRVPVPGTKGTLDELVLSLGSAGAFTAAVDMLRIWLGRDKTRSVELTYRDREGRSQRLNVSSTNATDETLSPIISAVAHQIEAAT